jgi:hypothetical protein
MLGCQTRRTLRDLARRPLAPSFSFAVLACDRLEVTHFLRPFYVFFFEGVRNYKSSEEKDLAPCSATVPVSHAAIAWN